LVRDRTGVVLDPYFSASKFKWLKENLQDASEAANSGTLRLGGTDSYLIHCLKGGAVHATEPGTASRTALYNLYALEWNFDLVEAFGLNINELPRILPSNGDFGTAQHESFIPSGVNADTRWGFPKAGKSESMAAYLGERSDGCSNRITVGF
jgi:glycerol kinase